MNISASSSMSKSGVSYTNASPELRWLQSTQADGSVVAVLQQKWIKTYLSGEPREEDWRDVPFVEVE